MLRAQDVLHLQRVLGNRITGQLVGTQAIQRAIIYKAHPKGEAPIWQKKLFAARARDRTATTGNHNYAIDCTTGTVRRSSSSAHAEILLIASSQADKSEEILVVSEYKPCPSCQKEFDRIEDERGVSIRVLYLLEYENKGDGDVTVTRNYYRDLGFLEGGGIYTYRLSEAGEEVAESY